MRGPGVANKWHRTLSIYHEVTHKPHLSGLIYYMQIYSSLFSNRVVTGILRYGRYHNIMYMTATTRTWLIHSTFEFCCTVYVYTRSDYANGVVEIDNKNPLLIKSPLILLLQIWQEPSLSYVVVSQLKSHIWDSHEWQIWPFNSRGDDVRADWNVSQFAKNINLIWLYITALIQN